MKKSDARRMLEGLFSPARFAAGGEVMNKQVSRFAAGGEVTDEQINKFVSDVLNMEGLTDVQRATMINEAASHFNVSRERIAEATPYTMKQVNEYLDTPIINSYVTKVLKNETLNDVQRADIINSAAKDVAKDVLGYEVSRDQLALATGYDTNIVNKYLDASNTQVPLAPVSDIRAGKQDQAISNYYNTVMSNNTLDDFQKASLVNQNLGRTLVTLEDLDRALPTVTLEQLTPTLQKSKSSYEEDVGWSPADYQFFANYIAKHANDPNTIAKAAAEYENATNKSITAADVLAATKIANIDISGIKNPIEIGGGLANVYANQNQGALSPDNYFGAVNAIVINNPRLTYAEGEKLRTQQGITGSDVRFARSYDPRVSEAAIGTLLNTDWRLGPYWTNPGAEYTGLVGLSASINNGIS